MTNGRITGPPSPDERENGYPEGTPEAIAGLKGRIAREIAENGPIRFDRFMERALYEPDLGYYARPGRLVGREGDFFTSVSVGALFGRLLARHLAGWWEGSGGPWRILELGAHDGSLAHDILSELSVECPAAFAEVEYAIIEPLAALRDRQRETLAKFGEAVRSVENAAALESKPGVVVGNELIDALPCRVVESTGEGWCEQGVDLNGDGEFVWCSMGAPEELFERLPARPAGYRTELRPDMKEFLAGLLPHVEARSMLWIDYGFEGDDYFAEGRSEGTLQTYLKHRKGGDPLTDPGSMDITAHVDFTAMAQAAEALGGKVTRFENQARFLTELARPVLLSLEGRTDQDAMKVVRQFQTLTHPGQLGSRFHVMEIDFSGRST